MKTFAILKNKRQTAAFRKLVLMQPLMYRCRPDRSAPPEEIVTTKDPKFKLQKGQDYVEQQVYDNSKTGLSV